MKLSGLIAATYTPMREDGRIDTNQIAPLVEHLAGHDVDGFYVCGSTGEGVSLTGAERREVAEHYIEAARPHRLPVVVQVGHNSIREARQLAEHARQAGADGISANAPSYFKISDLETLVDSMGAIASGAPELPFYYYHIPALTGANVDVVHFLEVATDRIPNLAGVKYTAPTVHEYQQCLRWRDGRHDVLWGSDEMLLSALVVGARGAVGSTYNIAAPLYKRIMSTYEAGDIDLAGELMYLAVSMIRIIYNYPFHSAVKAILKMKGIACGNCRLPQRNITAAQVEQLRSELDAIDFFEWSRPKAIGR